MIRSAMSKVMAIPRIVIGTLILFSIALNFANVIARYLFFAPILWAEEVMIYIMVWCVFMGSILVSWDGRHLKMDLISSSLRAPLKQWINGFAVMVFLVACGFVAVQSYKAVSLFTRLGQESTVAGIPMTIPHSALLIGFLLMIVGVAVRCGDHISGRLENSMDEVIQEFSDNNIQDKG